MNFGNLHLLRFEVGEFNFVRGLFPKIDVLTSYDIIELLRS